MSVRAVPIPGTQHDPSAQTGSGGPGDGGGSSSGGYYQYRYWMVCYDTAINGSYSETTCYKES